jgi:hypothetical protein
MRYSNTLSGSTRSTDDGFEALGNLAHQQILLARIFNAKTEFHTPRDHISQFARQKLPVVPTRRSPT